MHDITGIEVEVAKFQVAKSAVPSLVFGWVDCMDMMGHEVDQVLMIAAHDSESQSPGDGFEYASGRGKECATGFSLGEEILYCQTQMKPKLSLVYLEKLGARKVMNWY